MESGCNGKLSAESSGGRNDIAKSLKTKVAV